MAKPDDALAAYKSKRDFTRTPEPAGGGPGGAAGALQFVVQKHWASRLHYDFRLELGGSMKSWAVPKGPSLDPKDKRMAVQVEDHPMAYNRFEGTIPKGQYGAGKVIVWDKGHWLPLEDPQRGYAQGKLKFELHGHKLRGAWTLVRMHGPGRGKDGKAWLLIKERDELARPAAEFNVVDEMPDSVGHLAAPDSAVGRAAPGDALQGARKTSQPRALAPMLATLVDAPPRQGEDWLYEIKFDGYRMLARVDAREVRLFTRNGKDWTGRLPELARQLREMKLAPCWLDGEIVVLNDAGLPDFQALQNAFERDKAAGVVYCVFDLPWHAGLDLRGVPLVQRRARLWSLLQGKTGAQVRWSDVFDADVHSIQASACKLGLEGVIGKRMSSLYVTRRSADWIKLKCGHRQEFVIGGYTDPKGARVGLGSLLLGVYDAQGALRYAGNVGTGFDVETLAELKRRLEKLQASTNPFADQAGLARGAHWVEPSLVAEVRFAQWTGAGRVRHAVFHAMRSDKPARAVVRERPAHIAPDPWAAAPAVARTLPRGFEVSHPERVIDRASGATKIDLVRYYALVAPLMMEHLKARPVALLRAPSGIDGELFFQKHMAQQPLDGIRLLDPALDPGNAPLIEIAGPRGLLSAAQLNVVEFHTWNAVKTAIGKPDRMTFDLDPGKGVEWPAVQQGAELVRVLLEQLGLRSFLKTSGGKGVHVVVPLERRHDWDVVKDFSQAIVSHLARTLPDRFVARSGPRNRVGRIFVDYLRNGFGATTVCAWSVRARPGLGVSVPIAWEELRGIKSGAHWTLGNVHTRLDQGNAPWADYANAAQTLGTAMKTLGCPRD